MVSVTPSQCHRRAPGGACLLAFLADSWLTAYPVEWELFYLHSQTRVAFYLSKSEKSLSCLLSLPQHIMVACTSGNRLGKSSPHKKCKEGLHRSILYRRYLKQTLSPWLRSVRCEGRSSRKSRWLSGISGYIGLCPLNLYCLKLYLNPITIKIADPISTEWESKLSIRADNMGTMTYRRRQRSIVSTI